MEVPVVDEPVDQIDAVLTEVPDQFLVGLVAVLLQDVPCHVRGSLLDPHFALEARAGRGIIPVDSAALPPTSPLFSRRVTVRSSFSQAASVAVSPHPPAPAISTSVSTSNSTSPAGRPPRSRRLASAAAALYRANSYHGEETTPRKSTGRRGVAVRVPTLISPSPRRWRLFPSATADRHPDCRQSDLYLFGCVRVSWPERHARLSRSSSSGWVTQTNGDRRRAVRRRRGRHGPGSAV